MIMHFPHDNDEAIERRDGGWTDDDDV